MASEASYVDIFIKYAKNGPFLKNCCLRLNSVIRQVNF